MSQPNPRPRRSPSHRRGRRALTVAALAAAAPSAAVHAANIAFTGGDKTGNFNDPLNWATGTVPGSTDLAVFGDVGLSNAGTGGIIDTGAAQSIGTLAFGSANFTLSTPTTINNNSITLNVITGNGGLSRYGGGTGGVGATTGNDTVNSALILAKSQQWSIGGNTTSGSVVVNGVVSETAKSLLTKIGTGVLELSAANTFTGGYAVYAGTTIADNNASLGTDLTDNVQVGVTGGTSAVALVTNGVTNFAYNIGVVPNASAMAPVTLGGTVGQTSSTWTGTINVNRDIALTGGATGVTTFTGTLNTGSGASSNVTKINTGLVVLTGNNAYVGSTNVSAGGLRVNNTAGSGTGTGTVTVFAGAVLGGTGNISGGVAVSGNISAGATASTVGTLTTGSQAWNAGGGYIANFANTATGDKLIMSGLTVTATNASGGQFTVTPQNVALAAGTSYVIATDTNMSTGTVDPFNAALAAKSLVLATGSTTSATTGDTLTLSSVADGTGYDLLLNDVTASAPEPTGLLLAAVAAAPLAIGRRRRPAGA